MKVEKILKIIEKIGLLFLIGLILVVILNIYIYISVTDFSSKVLNLFYATNKITIANDYFFINSYDDFDNLTNDINSEMELFQKAFFKVNKGFIKRIFFRAFDSSFSEIEKDIDQLNYKFKSIYLIVKKLAKYNPENSAVLFNFLNNISSANSSLISDIELLKMEFYNNKILTTKLVEKVDKISKDINIYSNILKKNIIFYFFLFLLIYVSLYPLFVFVLFSVIRLKIKKLVDNMHKIRNGASILLLDSKEEMLSELYANIKDIILKNKDLFELKTNIISLDRKSSVIGQLANKIKDEILNQKHYLLSTTNSFKSLKDTIVTVSDSTLKTNFVTLETRDKTVSSCHTIRETIEGFKSLSETASKIFGILKIISAITDQTELLSLSASIESARAGEVGKGFNIVANEIRKLSESTVLSTKEISNFAKQIIKIIKTAISKSEFSNDALLSIEASVVEISKSITSLSGVAESHSNKCLEISNEVEEINKLNNEIFLLFEELTETIHNFSSKIDVLIKLSEKFDISSKAAISRKIRLVEVN